MEKIKNTNESVCKYKMSNTNTSKDWKFKHIQHLQIQTNLKIANTKHNVREHDSKYLLSTVTLFSL